MRLAPSFTIAVAAAIALGSAATSVIPARAADPAVCTVYAASAVSQNQKNKNMNCGYSGARWQSNYAAHYAWCLGVPKTMAQHETNARGALLAQCAGGGTVTKTFPAPKYNGLRLDWCYKWATQCGATAAKKFCQMKGYQTAESWGLAENIGTFTKTRVLASGQVCDMPDCDGFTYITCKK